MVGRLARDVVALINDRAVARRQKTDERAHQGALADAVAAKHADHFAGAHLDADVLKDITGGVTCAQRRGCDQGSHRSSLAEVDAAHVGVLGDLGDTSFGEHPALMHHGDALGDVAHERDIMLDHDNG